MLGRSPPLEQLPPGGRDVPPTPGAGAPLNAPEPPRPRDIPQPRNPDDRDRRHNAEEANARCKIPNYWNFNPTLWFAQVEAALASSGILLDHRRYNLLVAHLPPEVAQEVSDIILAPPAANRYDTLKAAVLKRLADSSELQLHQLLNEVRLDDRTPSQLLRHMRRLGGAAITDEALKVKWLDLLPSYASRMCRVLTATSLDELAILADKLTAQEPSVNAVNRRPSPTPSSGVSSGTCTPVEVDPLTTLNNNVAQLVSIINKQSTILQSVSRALSSGAQNDRSRPTARSASRQRRSPTPSPSAANSSWCWYHQKHGKEAVHCKPPCAFPAQGN